MARRPNVQSDRDDWGAVLNDYLDVSLNEDGTIKDEAAAALPISDATQAALARVSPHMVRRALDEGVASLAVQVLGDSTGNELGEWVDLLAQDIAAAYPDHEVRHYLWNGATQRIPAVPIVVQAGPTQERHLPFTGVANQNGFFAGETVTGDLDVRVRIEPDAWSGTIQTITCQYDDPPNRAWRFGLWTGGNIYLEWSTDGTNMETRAQSSTWTPPAGATWIRATLDVDNGADGHDYAFYWSEDGTTWTQIGSTTTRAGTTSVADVAAEYRIGSRGTSELFVGKLYEVQIRDGIGGPTVAPCLPEYWTGFTFFPDAIGDPILSIVNGSHSGADITYLADPARLAAMTPDYGQVLAIISSSHNEIRTHGDVLRTEIAAYLAAVHERLPGVAFAGLTQNPRIAPAEYAVAQAQRRIEYLAWANTLGWTPIDTYGAFIDSGDVASLLNADGFHPNAAGSRVWADAVAASLGLG